MLKYISSLTSLISPVRKDLTRVYCSLAQQILWEPTRSVLRQNALKAMFITIALYQRYYYIRIIFCVLILI